MKNIYKTKIKVNYSIDNDIIKKFNKTADDKAINKSKLIGQLIKIWLDENI